MVGGGGLDVVQGGVDAVHGGGEAVQGGGKAVTEVLHLCQQGPW